MTHDQVRRTAVLSVSAEEDDARKADALIKGLNTAKTDVKVRYIGLNEQDFGTDRASN